MTTTALYLRQSLDRTKDEAAIDRQRSECRALAARKGWTDLVEYVDNDRSATNTRKPRPEYQRLLTDMAAGRVGAVICWDLDRLHRRPIELETFMPLADSMKIKLATVSGETDLSTAQGRLTARIKGDVAAHEGEHKAARQRAAAKQAAERGIPKWRTAFGYAEDGTHKPHRVEARLVRRAYQSILSGGSLAGIAREWNAKGRYGRNGSPWTASSVSLFLRSPRNAGLRSHNDVIVGPGNWPAVVDENTWRATQSMLDDPARKPGPKTVRKHFLSGMLICGRCGATMTAYVNARGRHRYRCGKCLRVAIGRADTDDLIRGIVCARLALPDARELLIDRDAPDLDKLSAEANVIRARMDELATEFADGDLTPSQLRVATQRLRDKIDAIEAKMADASAASVFADVPLGTDRVHRAFTRVDVDRQRAIINIMLTATVMPVGKPGRLPFDPERVKIEWRR
ncbi:MAG TPA: recombinase family protein [Mycobacterium sp.]|jgi:DNA invertase Pin-like site-specific DNA recombinase|nr:recombinase family protein [Mycobacterium sp.]